jgi:hypothetical protein
MTTPPVDVDGATSHQRIPALTILPPEEFAADEMPARTESPESGIATVMVFPVMAFTM